ncbi:MAG: CehA/McbA family metallohydrolase [Planctomycetaceae bacterium]|nr:CehA/McbA family metallohydrolase [Planctomycetaceae bacterium]
MRISLFVAVGVCLLMIGGLTSVPATQDRESCQVRLSLVDAVSGEPLPGLIRVRTTQGEYLPLAPLLPRGQGLPEADAIAQWFALVRPAIVRVPRAQLEFAAFSGLDTELTVESVDLQEHSSADVKLKLRRFHNAREQGLQNANTHVHINKITRAESDRYLVESATADGLDLVFVSYLERAEADVEYTSNRYARSDLHALNTNHVHFDNGEEHRHNFAAHGQGYGHVMLLSIPELVYPVSIGPGIMKTGTDGIPLRRGIERAHDIGGTVIWCHNDWGLEDVPNWLSGRLHANNIFDGGTHGSYAHSFYRYWNAGIRVPMSTGTDWFIYDFNRVYVPAPGRITPEQWLDQLAAGRSFITNGPLLEFTVDGLGIGEPLVLDAPRSIGVKGRAIGRVDFARLELIRNGEVINAIASRPTGGSEGEGGHFSAELDLMLDVSVPCWIALRTPPPFAPNDPQFASRTPENEFGGELFSHTSATFIDVGNRRVFQVDAAQSLLDDMQNSRPLIAQEGLFADDAEQRAVLEVYDEGIAVMQARLAAAASTDEGNR